jgi:hypothetical protein
MRVITPAEYGFLCRVARAAGKPLNDAGLSSEAIVESMTDGGMGSIRFAAPGCEGRERRLGEVFAEGAFTDRDGVPVSFSVNLDEEGALFELDIWRVDFQTLQSLPREDGDFTLS